MKAKIYVTLKAGILDPQGEAIQHSLETLGYAGLRDVRMGKYLEITLTDRAADEALRDLEGMCRKLLANPVVEDYRFEVESLSK